MGRRQGMSRFRSLVRQSRLKESDLVREGVRLRLMSWDCIRVDVVPRSGRTIVGPARSESNTLPNI